MNKFDKQSIIAFSNETNSLPFEEAYLNMEYIIDKAMNDIMDVNPHINNYDIFIANEALSGTEIPSSSLDLFLAIDAKQIELNFNEDKFYKLKSDISKFFKKFAKNFKLFNTKKKNKKKKDNLEESSENKIQISEKKLAHYNTKDLYCDIQKQLANYFSFKTNLGLTSNSIQINGKEDIGIQVNVYIVFTNKDNTFNLYNLNTKKKATINFKSRYENFDIKNIKTNYMYKTQIRIFNSMFFNMFKYEPNQVLIESILFSCPNELFSDNCFETTVCLINYLKNNSMQNLISICDSNELLKEDLISKDSIAILYRFIRKIKIIND